jgi:hypothetical protein
MTEDLAVELLQGKVRGVLYKPCETALEEKKNLLLRHFVLL